MSCTHVPCSTGVPTATYNFECRVHLTHVLIDDSESNNGLGLSRLKYSMARCR